MTAMTISRALSRPRPASVVSSRTAASRPVLLALVLAVAVLAPGCAALGSSNAASDPASDPSANEVPATVADPATLLTLPAALAIADGHGWDDGGLHGTMPAPASCRPLTSPSGALVPDPVCTPGIRDDAVTQETVTTTICRPGGYTDSVRPPVSMTNAAKWASMRAYAMPGSPSDYEYDHFVPLSLGGASDVANLWPEPNDPAMTGGFARNPKDTVETALWRAVCAGRVTLAAAQQAIVTDWNTALVSLGLA